MANYAYKRVLLPKHIVDAMGPDYDGDPNYDGDMWDATANYIDELLDHRNSLLEALQAMRALKDTTPIREHEAVINKADTAINKAHGIGGEE